MAATGYTPIQLYNTTTASAQPVVGNMAAGELALNITDGKLYYKDTNTNTIKLLASNAATTNVSTINFGTTGLTPSTATSGAVTVAGTLTVANGGTGATSLTANNVLLGNGTSALQAVAPGTAGNVLTSNGTTWASTAPAATGATKGQAIAFSLIFGLQEQ